MNPFKPSGVISITTDFGHKGPFVGTMKGVMLERFPQVRIVDVTHEIPVHWPAEAGFWLSRSFRFFPDGTVHVAVVDPGVGTGREVIALVTKGHVFIAPDNGLLSPLVNGAEIYRLAGATLDRLALPPPSRTFHGRDIFAPVAAAIAAGELAPSDIGPAVSDVVTGLIDEPVRTRGELTGIVVTVDTFGNLITNIDAKLLDAFRKPIVHIGAHRIALRETYGQVTPGEYLALVNSFDVLEIARGEQSAASGLGLSRGAPVRVSEAGE